MWKNKISSPPKSGYVIVLFRLAKEQLINLCEAFLDLLKCLAYAPSIGENI